MRSQIEIKTSEWVMQRRFPRAHAPTLVVGWRRAGEESDQALEPGRIWDLSEGGLFLCSETPGRFGEPVIVLLEDSPDRTLEVEGTIVHVVGPEAIAPSTPMGMGIAFRQLEPAARQHIQSLMAAHAQARPEPERPTVIIVDDDRDVREALQVFLELEGFWVLVAPNGLKLLSTLRVDRPRAILLDVRMSWIDGFELCRAIKSNDEYRHIPVFFISARTDPAYLERGAAVGGADYFAKPIDTDRLLMRLREVIGDVTVA